MHTRSSWRSRLTLSLLALLTLVALPPNAALAQTIDRPVEQDVGEVFVLSIGGKLYDNLFVMTGIEPPKNENPKFPADVSSKRYGTWRCVACHGWDYAGAGGERGADGKARAFHSLRGVIGADPKEIAAKIKSAPHAYSAQALPDYVAEILGLFLSIGQYDRNALLNKSGLSSGSATDGQSIFEGACSNCHQLDGRAYLRGERGDKSSLGWLARNRPEQVLHKVLNGFPGTDMLAMRFMPDKQIGDLMAYLQTLDSKQP